MPKRKWIAGPTVALLVVGLGTACSNSSGGGGSGGGTRGVYASFAAMSGDARETALVKAAKKEANLTVYSSNTDMQKTLIPAFEKKYGLKVKLYRATDEQVTERALQEGQNGRGTADVIEDDTPLMDTLSAAGLLTAYSSPIRDAAPAAAKFKYWTADRYSVVVLVRNTKMVPESKLPKNFADLAKPEWKGKLALESSDYNWYLSIYKYFHDQGMSDADFETMFKGIAKNSKSVSGHPNIITSIEAGELAMCPDEYTQYPVKDAAKGAPIAFTPILGPVLEDPVGTALMKDAPHPAAALLFSDWYLSDGQALIAGLNRQPANPGAVRGYKSVFPPGTKISPFDDATLGNPTKAKAWEKAYSNLLQGSGDILP